MLFFPTKTSCFAHVAYLLCGFHQPERLCDEEIDHLEQKLQSQALRLAGQQSNTYQQEESPVPNNCFKFQNRVFGESK